MDARITKQRLGNMLSYDWLKILCSIAVAVVALVLFFTMVKVRPARAQKFYVHFYGEYSYGTDDYPTFADDIKPCFSYDVLTVGVQSFGNGMMEGASYTARRSVGEGSVAIAADYTTSTSENAVTPYVELVQTGLTADGQNMFYHPDEFFSDLDGYLARFFGEDWRGAPVYNAEEAEKCFRARNVDGPNNRNRYRSRKQIEAGLKDERDRLETLREDYLFLLDRGLGGEQLPYVTYTIPASEDGTRPEKTYAMGIGIGGLQRLGELVYYKTAEGSVAREKFCLLIYDNGGEPYEEGKTNDGRYDLRYEAVGFLRYLVETYQ